MLGVLLVYLGIFIARPWVMAEYGFYLKTWLPDAEALSLLAMVAALAVVFSLLPGAIAYRRSLQDGLTVRV